MSFNFTFGEWVATKDVPFHGEKHIAVGLAGTGKILALCGVSGANDEAESAANAVLIAAAPEMLFSLLEVVATLAKRQQKTAEDDEAVQHAMRVALGITVKAIHGRYAEPAALDALVAKTIAECPDWTAGERSIQ